jgi:hypothetical protein
MNLLDLRTAANDFTVHLQHFPKIGILSLGLGQV